MKRHNVERRFSPLSRKKATALFLFLLGAGVALSAQSIDGAVINSKVAGYADNASKLIPDVITMQNVWAGAPTKAGSFGLGVTANGAVFSMDKIDDAINGYNQFAGQAASLDNFPDSILFLPAGAGEMRISLPKIPIDIGLTGMGYDLGNLIGSDSQYLFWTGGVDLRVDVVGLLLLPIENRAARTSAEIANEAKDKAKATARAKAKKAHEEISDKELDDAANAAANKAIAAHKKSQEAVKSFWLIPRLTLIGGYYLSGMRFDFTANDDNVWFDFKTDTYFLAAQITENLRVIRLFGGIRAVGSGTNIQYGWETDKPVQFEGTTYAEGAKYTAPVNQGDDFLYFQVYGGLSLFGDFLTAGAMYNIITQHVGVSASVRLRFGG
ncbi:MAG: hypothetical protein LBE74_08250 [Treponema sp.]|jgi:hypothetical protein|nr:hypothetical protein [Treponema sp.]